MIATFTQKDWDDSVSEAKASASTELTYCTVCIVAKKLEELTNNVWKVKPLTARELMTRGGNPIFRFEWLSNDAAMLVRQFDSFVQYGRPITIEFPFTIEIFACRV